MNANLRKRLWTLATALIIVYTAFSVARNLIHAFRIKTQINAMMQEKRYFEERIAADSALLEELQYDDYLEKYAREHYRMQRRGEHIYLVE